MVTWFRFADKPADVFRTTPDADVDIVWSWRVGRLGADPRHVKVEVAGGCLHSRDLPRESKEAIRTLGASAVDAFRDEDELPHRLVVSSLGVRPREPAV